MVFYARYRAGRARIFLEEGEEGAEELEKEKVGEDEIEKSGEESGLSAGHHIGVGVMGEGNQGSWRDRWLSGGV